MGRKLLLPLLVALSLLMAANLVLAPTWKDVPYMLAWIVAQWMPMNSLRVFLQERAWKYWEQERYPGSMIRELEDSLKGLKHPKHLPVPSVNVREHGHHLSQYLQDRFGADWQKRPLLLRNLWTADELADPSRRISLNGLLRENLTIPYFADARLENALSPNAQGTVASIVANMTQGYPHKIGTQFVVQAYPDLVKEIAPHNILTELFGDFFSPDHVRGTMAPWLPPLTTVPLFVAASSYLVPNGSKPEKPSFTALHCEPIGNVAVQLSGSKQWTLVDPAFSFLIRPSTAPDGRAFFASWKPIPTQQQNDDPDEPQTTTDGWDKVPTYTGVTSAGDAMWVPTWTWHRVDYIADNNKDGSNDIAIGGSLFHFRPKDFVVNNPLFAVLMIPAMILELVGINTQ